MITAARSRAEKRFDEIQKRQYKALSEQEQIAEDRRANSERLRQLRLRKDAEEIAHNTKEMMRRANSRQS